MESVAGFVGFEGAELRMPDGPVYARVEEVEVERSLRIRAYGMPVDVKGLDLPSAAAIDLGNAGEVGNRDLEVNDAENYCAARKGNSENHDDDGSDLGEAKASVGNRRARDDEALEQVEVNRTIVKDEEDIDG